MRRDEGKFCLAHSSGHGERSRQLWPKRLEARAMLWSLRCAGLCYPGQWPAQTYSGVMHCAPWESRGPQGIHTFLLLLPSIMHCLLPAQPYLVLGDFCRHRPTTKAGRCMSHSLLLSPHGRCCVTVSSSGSFLPGPPPALPGSSRQSSRSLKKAGTFRD